MMMHSRAPFEHGGISFGDGGVSAPSATGGAARIKNYLFPINDTGRMLASARKPKAKEDGA
jgi:hypothetical protein